jgi:hypothetical protein
MIAWRLQSTSSPVAALARFSLQPGLSLAIKTPPIRQVEPMTHDTIGFELAAVGGSAMTFAALGDARHQDIAALFGPCSGVVT